MGDRLSKTCRCIVSNLWSFCCLGVRLSMHWNLKGTSWKGGHPQTNLFYLHIYIVCHVSPYTREIPVHPPWPFHLGSRAHERRPLLKAHLDSKLLYGQGSHARTEQSISAQRPYCWCCRQIWSKAHNACHDHIDDKICWKALAFHWHTTLIVNPPTLTYGGGLFQKVHIGSMFFNMRCTRSGNHRTHMLKEVHLNNTVSPETIQPMSGGLLGCEWFLHVEKPQKNWGYPPLILEAQRPCQSRPLRNAGRQACGKGRTYVDKGCFKIRLLPMGQQKCTSLAENQNCRPRKRTILNYYYHAISAVVLTFSR